MASTPSATVHAWHNAALLAAGERSGLSNRSAGAHWQMTKAPAKPHVIAPRSADGVKGIVVHRPRALAPGDVVEDRGKRRRGAPLLRAVLEWHIAGSSITESEAEEAFLAIVDGSGLPRPAPQAGVIGRRRDFVWPERRIVVEIDGWNVHRTVQAADRDAQRGNEALLAAGCTCASRAGGWCTAPATFSATSNERS